MTYIFYSVCSIVCAFWTQPFSQYPHYSLRLTRSWCFSQWWTFDRISSLLLRSWVHAKSWVSPADAARVPGPTWRGPPLSARSDLRVYGETVKQMKHCKSLIVAASREEAASLQRGSQTRYCLRGSDAVNQRAFQSVFRWGRQEAQLRSNEV